MITIGLNNCLKTECADALQVVRTEAKHSKQKEKKQAKERKIDEEKEEEDDDEDEDEEKERQQFVTSAMVETTAPNAVIETNEIEKFWKGQESESEEKGDEEVFIEYPKRAADPINEFKTPNLLCGVFPWLFWNTAGDFTASRTIKISFEQHINYLLQLGYFEVDERTGEQYVVYPFAADDLFCLWVNSWKQRESALYRSRIFITNHPQWHHKTIDSIQKIVMDVSKRKDVIDAAFRYTAKITGSPGYWWKACNELKALWRQEGYATAWMTYTMHDLHCKKLMKLLGCYGAPFKVKR